MLMILLVIGIGCATTGCQLDEFGASDNEAAESDDGEPASERMAESDTHPGGLREVVTATVDISSGTVLAEELITTQEVPDHHLPTNPLLAEELMIYLGMPVEVDIDADSMLSTSHFKGSGSARTAASQIPSGERAYFLPGDSTGGQSTPIQPGDRLDILGTMPSDGDSLTLSVLQNVTVISVGSCVSTIGDQRCIPGDVAVAVTPEEAELLTVLRDMGSLTVLLRNHEDRDPVPADPRSSRDVLQALESAGR